MTWPVTLNDDGGGVYSGNLPAATQVVENKKYDLKITAEKDGRTADWNDSVGAKRRGFDE